MPASVLQPGDTEFINRVCRGVHSYGYFFLRKDCQKLGEAYWTGSIWWRMSVVGGECEDSHLPR
jgi:hypothetical protein